MHIGLPALHFATFHQTYKVLTLHSVSAVLLEGTH